MDLNDFAQCKNKLIMLSFVMYLFIIYH